MEFTHDSDEIFFDQIWFFGLPIAILFTLTGTLKREDTKGTAFAKTISTILFAFLPFLFAIATALSGLCSWTTEKILFENKNDKSTKIVLRDFGCGAVDSTSPTPGVFKIKYYTSHFIWVSEIDTNKIDKNLWIRIENKRE